MYHIEIEKNNETYYLKDLVTIDPNTDSDYSDGMFVSEWTNAYHERNTFNLSESAQDIIDEYTKKGKIVADDRKSSGAYTADMKWSVSS